MVWSSKHEVLLHIFSGKKNITCQVNKPRIALLCFFTLYNWGLCQWCFGQRRLLAEKHPMDTEDRSDGHHDIQTPPATGSVLENLWCEKGRSSTPVTTSNHLVNILCVGWVWSLRSLDIRTEQLQSFTINKTARMRSYRGYWWYCRTDGDLILII